MFTGIVTHRGKVTSRGKLEAHPGVERLVLTVEPPLARAELGDSIAIDGTCLTVVEAAVEGARATYAFDVIPETLRLTTLGSLSAGDEVNLEGALRAGDPFGGHIVQGHVHGVGEVMAVERGVDHAWGDLRLVLSAPDGIHACLMPKGCVTVHGVSLTVGEVWRDDTASPEGHAGRFSVYLIPHTQEVTGLGRLVVGDRQNLEPDPMSVQVKQMVDAALATRGLA